MERFPHPYGRLSSLLQPMCDLTIHSFGCTQFTPWALIAHHSVTSFDIVCNDLSLLSANIILFGLSLWCFSFKTRLIFHTLIRNLRSPIQQTCDRTKTQQNLAISYENLVASFKRVRKIQP